MAVEFTSGLWEYSNRTATGDSGTNVGIQFASTTSTAHAVAMPSSVTHSGITYTVNRANIITSSGLKRGAFEGRTLMEDASAVEMPSSIRDVSGCFAGCASLKGNITVSNAPTSSYSIFSGTSKRIYVVRTNSARNNESVATAWRAITANYNNVRFEADDTPAPRVTISTTRVSSSGSTQQDNSGVWVYISANATYYSSNLPDGWSIEKSITTTLDGTSVSPTWSGDSGQIEAWVNVGDTDRHILEVYLTTTIKASSITRATKVSSTASSIIPSALPTIDVLAGGGGIAFGKTATDPGFWCSMDAYFKDRASQIRKLFDFIHPVGSLYKTKDATFDPSATWGGTWSSKQEPYIVEQGASDIWTYRKWSDGTAECWGNLTGSVSSWAQWGSLYYSTRIANKAFPTNLFNAVPTVSATIQGASQDVFLCTNGSADATQTSGFYLMRPANATATTYTIGLYARGKWASNTLITSWERDS